MGKSFKDKSHASTDENFAAKKSFDGKSSLTHRAKSRTMIDSVNHGHIPVNQYLDKIHPAGRLILTSRLTDGQKDNLKNGLFSKIRNRAI